MQLGPHTITNPVMLAPMAGMSDLPFREICRELGAGYAVGEMTTSKPELRESRKSAGRWAQETETGLKVVQLLGADPRLMADAARYAADTGADVVDINMGCPAKKVLQTACGSALLRDEARVAAILDAVVAAVDIPVTLKIRTGWSAENRNALSVAKRAEEAGVAMLVVHGRTGEQGFRGEAEYETIRAVKESVSIPVIANGDVDSPEKAEAVLRATGADGLMIGRASYGNPWLFGAVSARLGFGGRAVEATPRERRRVVLRHLEKHYAHYGCEQGVRTARKHIAHYLKLIPGGSDALPAILRAQTSDDQFGLTDAFFQRYCEEAA